MLTQMLVPLAIALIHFTEAVANLAECAPPHTHSVSAVVGLYQPAAP